jgi:hypothetical protein
MDDELKISLTVLCSLLRISCVFFDKIDFNRLKENSVGCCKLCFSKRAAIILRLLKPLLNKKDFSKCDLIVSQNMEFINHYLCFVCSNYSQPMKELLHEYLEDAEASADQENLYLEKSMKARDVFLFIDRFANNLEIEKIDLERRR